MREQRVIDPQDRRLPLRRDGIARLDAILRAILRAGAFELLFREDVPARVVISEYLDVAHAFFEREVLPFVNGVLDKLARKLRPGELPERG